MLGTGLPGATWIMCAVNDRFILHLTPVCWEETFLKFDFAYLYPGAEETEQDLTIVIGGPMAITGDDIKGGVGLEGEVMTGPALGIGVFLIICQVEVGLTVIMPGLDCTINKHLFGCIADTRIAVGIKTVVIRLRLDIPPVDGDGLTGIATLSLCLKGVESDLIDTLWVKALIEGLLLL